ncbi:putative haloacid dehalogenase-like hydrolase [Phialemonium atrogriseum]|uniref:Haloacid dehalogenase-like hydrolase n=1 Tax=Phialemonium atrogriseum TaxID=1093897 RepID=A0AAJ0C004_9PEZI|nr:putative haloacid dehalogenase-like hydrolase [Phialemonium atrogriseum]KAK1766192.1 putative haloacid dehalogenase-like hydrolase [Phialemonium atrogriseum]
MPKITTLLFDCDNTLVLSEELAFEGCAELLNEICAAKGVRLEQQFTGPALIVEFVGQNFRGMVTSLQARYGFDLTPEELDDYVRREEDVVIARLRAALRPCPGVDAELEKLAEHRRYHLAVVSSSALRRVQASIEKVGHDKFFNGEHVFSAANSLPKPTSKPDPAIYLHSMKVLGKNADECVAVEDSKSGTTSAARAGIKVIGYVGPYEEERRPEMEKVLRDAGASVIMQDWSEFESCLEKIENGSS